MPYSLDTTIHIFLDGTWMLERIMGVIQSPGAAKLVSRAWLWDYQTWYSSLYEKIDTKIIQVYLAPVGLISAFSSDKNILPYNIVWFGMMVLLILVTGGREQFLAMTTLVTLQFTCITVIAGLGFTERYAAMLAPLQIVLSGIFFTVIIRKAYQIFILHQAVRGSKKEI